MAVEMTIPKSDTRFVVAVDVTARVPYGGNAMLTRLLTGLTLLAVLVGSTPARAQEAPAGGEETHSKIDGQLVPVGEQNKYEYAYKKHLVSTNPLSWFFGSFTAGYTYAFHKYIAARVDVGFVHFWATDLYGGQLSASLPIYVKKMHDGFCLEPGAYMMGMEYNGATAFAGGPQLLLGWAWIWDSGFNLNLGLGITYTWVSAEAEGETAAIDGPWPKGRLAFGYAW